MHCIKQLIIKAEVDWLNVSELEYLLDLEITPLQISTNPPSSFPPSGSLLLYDRILTRSYKNDGYHWIKKRNSSSRVREDHVKLMSNGKCRVAGVYIHCQNPKSLHKRIYRVLRKDCNDMETSQSTNYKKSKNKNHNLVLVHYLDLSAAAQNIFNREQCILEKKNSLMQQGKGKRKRCDDGSYSEKNPVCVQKRSKVSKHRELLPPSNFHDADGVNKYIVENIPKQIAEECETHKKIPGSTNSRVISSKENRKTCEFDVALDFLWQCEMDDMMHNHSVQINTNN